MKSLLVLFYLLSLNACGIKGKPLPPVPESSLPSVEVEKTRRASETAPLKTMPVKKKKK